MSQELLPGHPQAPREQFQPTRDCVLGADGVLGQNKPLSGHRPFLGHNEVPSRSVAPKGSRMTWVMDINFQGHLLSLPLLVPVIMSALCSALLVCYIHALPSDVSQVNRRHIWPRNQDSLADQLRKNVTQPMGLSQLHSFCKKHQDTESIGKRCWNWPVKTQRPWWAVGKAKV